MFPNLYIWKYILPLTGVWLIMALIVFVTICYIEFRKIWFDFWRLFFALPYMIWLPYFLWRYVDMIVVLRVIFPHSKSQILSILSSFNYNFHYIWVCVWILAAILIFLKSNYKYRHELMVIIFDALMQSMVVLGIFWVIGDDFVGRPNDWSFAIWSIAQVSKINSLWKVYPLGIILSFVGMFVYIITSYLRNKKKDNGYILFGYGLFLLMMNIVFYYQHYSRYLPIKLFGWTLDIKNYFTTLLGIYILYRFAKYRRDKKYSDK